MTYELESRQRIPYKMYYLLKKKKSGYILYLIYSKAIIACTRSNLQVVNNISQLRITKRGNCHLIILISMVHVNVAHDRLSSSTRMSSWLSIM